MVYLWVSANMIENRNKHCQANVLVTVIVCFTWTLETNTGNYDNYEHYSYYNNKHYTTGYTSGITTR